MSRAREYRQGDVILIPCPFTDFLGTKKRPALVISSNRYNERWEDVIILALSSKVTSERDDYLLSDMDLKLAKLDRQTVVKLGKIITMSKNRILGKIGRLPPETVKEIIQSFITDVVTIT